MHAVKSNGKVHKFENCHSGHNCVVTQIDMGTGNNKDRCYRAHCPYCGYFAVDETVSELHERWQDRLHSVGNRPNKFVLNKLSAAVSQALADQSQPGVRH